jgi:hypothetical protein
MPPLLIGTVKSVIGHRCEVMLRPDLQSMHLTHDGVLYSVGQLGSYVCIPTAFDKIVGVVAETRLLDVVNPGTGGEAFISDKKLLRVALVGTIAGVRFERGVRAFPLVNDDVYLATAEDYDAIFGGVRSKACVEFGRSSEVETYRVPVDIDKLFSKPVAIVGTTGAGKSYTVASLIHQVLALPEPRILVIDLHGEYTTCFGNSARVLSRESGLEVPYWLFNYQELQDLCIDRNEREAPNQAMIFKNEVVSAKKQTATAEGLQLDDSVSIDSPVYFDFQSVYRAIDLVNRQMVEGSSGRQRQGDFFGQFNRFLVRLESRLSDYRYGFIFRPERFDSSASLKTLMEELFGRGPEARKITIVDLSGVPSDVIQSVVALLCRVAFDFTFWKLDYAQSPLLLVCEEAHSYAGKNISSESRRMVERIAKEGRKYGIGLVVVSQRPAEVSETILSQCNNFIVMRLTNPVDQEYVRALVPDQYQDLMDILPALRRGEALFLGDATLMPLRVQIDVIPDEGRIPRSRDVSFYEGWQAVSQAPVDDIIERWRRQRKNIGANQPNQGVTPEPR